MSEVELFLIKDGENCTIYTLQFLRDMESEFEKFIAKFRDDAEYSEDYARIAAFVTRIARTGALERYFRNEGKMSDSVVAASIACVFPTKSLYSATEESRKRAVTRTTPY